MPQSNPLSEDGKLHADTVAPESEVQRKIMYVVSQYTGHDKLMIELASTYKDYKASFTDQSFIDIFEDLKKLYFPYTTLVSNDQLKFSNPVIDELIFDTESSILKAMYQFALFCEEEYLDFNHLQRIVFNAAKSDDIFYLTETSKLETKTLISKPSSFFKTKEEIEESERKRSENSKRNFFHLFLVRDKHGKSSIDYANSNGSKGFLNFVNTKLIENPIPLSNYVRCSLTRFHLKIIFNQMTEDDYKAARIKPTDRANKEKFFEHKKIYFSDQTGDNQKDSRDGANPLHFAAMFGNADAITQLTKKVVIGKITTDEGEIEKTAQGYKITTFDAFSRTPLHYAAMHNQAEVIPLLCNPTTIDAIDENGRTALSYAAENGFHKVVEQLVKAKANDLITPGQPTALHWAATNGDAVSVKWLMKVENPKVDVVYEEETPLHRALAQVTTKGNACAYVILRNQNVKINVNITGKNNKTILQLALERDRSEMVDSNLISLILMRKPDLSLPNSGNFTPSQYSYRFSRLDVSKIINCAERLHYAEQNLTKLSQYGLDEFRKERVIIDTRKSYLGALEIDEGYFKFYLYNLLSGKIHLPIEVKEDFLAHVLPVLLVSNESLKEYISNIELNELSFSETTIKDVDNEYNDENTFIPFSFGSR